MTNIHFFTDPNSILQLQQPDFAFGEISDEDNYERYNLENRFEVSQNAPVYAICKSLILMSLDSENSSLLNIALMPLDNYGGGIPIKFIIYRGINKADIYDSNGFIKPPDNTWQEKNILKVIFDLQNKINTDSGIISDPTNECLGIQFESLSPETPLEHILYDDLNFFHPLIVEAGCQIGKFSGNTNTAGIEVIIDKIGYDATFGILRSNSHIIHIKKLVIDNGLSEKEQLKLKFRNRYFKEEILAYLDITALYGACINQAIKIKGTTDIDFLNFFANKNVVYLDIRDKRGFSFNHFLDTSDLVKIGLKIPTEEKPVFSDYQYYNTWPILKIDGLSYPSDEEKFYLKIPILSTNYRDVLVLTSYSGRVSLGTGNSRGEYYNRFNVIDKDGNVFTNYSQEIQLKNWKNSNGKLGSNYFLLKLDILESKNQNDILSPIWESFFSMKMLPFQGLENIPEGELRIRTYSSLNAPLLIDNGRNRIFAPKIGIVVDKYHVSFFVFYHDTADNGYAEQEGNFPIEYLGTGKFKFFYDAEDLEYDQNYNQSVGFLYYISQLKERGINNYKLKKYVFDDAENDLSQKKFVKYVKEGNPERKDFFFDNFEVITLTHIEYNTLLDRANSLLSNDDYFFEHPLYVRSKNIHKHEYPKFSFIQNSITLGIPKIETTNEQDEAYINFVEYPENIEINNEEITLHSVLLN